MLYIHLRHFLFGLVFILCQQSIYLIFLQDGSTVDWSGLGLKGMRSKNAVSGVYSYSVLLFTVLLLYFFICSDQWTFQWLDSHAACVQQHCSLCGPRGEQGTLNHFKFTD